MKYPTIINGFDFRELVFLSGAECSTDSFNVRFPRLLHRILIFDQCREPATLKQNHESTDGRLGWV